MGNLNTSHWMIVAKEKGIDLSFLEEDKIGVDKKIQELDLPGQKVFYLTSEEVNTQRAEDLLSQYNFFCRLIPKDKDVQREYHPYLETVEEFRKFCGEFDLSQYIIQLKEKERVIYSGAIIVKGDRCIVELIEGENSSEELFHSLKTPVHAEVDPWTKTIRYENGIPKIEMRKIVFNALKLIGGPKHPFPGYYEFQVWAGTKINFYNYHSPDSGYINLEAKVLTP